MIDRYRCYRSLIYNTNTIGHTTDPCLTSDFTIELFEKELSTLVFEIFSLQNYKTILLFY